MAVDEVELEVSSLRQARYLGHSVGLTAKIYAA